MRIWNGREKDHGSVHSFGNGKMCAYSMGPDIFQVFGPPYTASTSLVLFLDEEGASSASQRETGRAIWDHEISKNGEKVGDIKDFIDSDIAVFVRRANFTKPTKFMLQIEHDRRIAEVHTNVKDCKNKFELAVVVPRGAFMFQDYSSLVSLHYRVIVNGDFSYEVDPTYPNKYFLTLKGECEILIVGGPTYENCVLASEEAVSTSFEDMLSRTRAYWDNFTSRRKDFNSIIPKDFPQREKLLDTIDSVSVLIKAQQSVEGGVQAGHNYHLAYVRDQYGVSRALLALGYVEEARMIMDHYYWTWSRNGAVYNAQGMGVDGIFHIHENDDVEITGYLVIQMFDILNASGDEDYVKDRFDMMLWAWNAQKKHLAGGMLPFNGDETYVAGGVLPRYTLNDGSAEATLLFLTGGKKMLDFGKKHNLFSEEEYNTEKAVYDDTLAKYHENFIKDGKIQTNNPLRKELTQIPRFRHGVCEACRYFDEENRGVYYGWTEINKDGHYICPICYGKRDHQVERGEDVFYLQSVSLAAQYVNSDVIPKDILLATVKNVMDNYYSSGNLSSNAKGGMSLGYDYGFLLYNLVKLGFDSKDKESVYNEMLKVLDDAGAWVEYYENGVGFLTRCRPWESGINIEAAITYATEGK